MVLGWLSVKPATFSHEPALQRVVQYIGFSAGFRNHGALPTFQQQPPQWINHQTGDAGTQCHMALHNSRND